METPNTGWSLLSMIGQRIDIAGHDVIENIIDGQKGPSLTLLATKVVHRVKKDAQETLRRNVAGLVGLKPLAVDTGILIESCSEPLNVLHSFEEPRHKLSFWACLHREDWRSF
jgi:hypothetical protein